ncbi:flavin-dependent monooxygenase [Parapedobacter pyrenivorans]|uniref:Flavin-dependent monooxygenase n=1 Tax=Parapedobacter pyrenivorans TaxID=1305674 RepID=A0A917HWS4_9SPHI|nr:acyl-CoA dehydrogenase [Parapedobacter pyrenivorans]GGG91243.1 flavin-dependent monooxygenase [Parapedobacter pyrenivorans]
MKEEKNFPESTIPVAVSERLRGLSADAEAAGELTAGISDVIQDYRWFKLFVPRSLGGLELSLSDGVRLEEELARIDGSLGWTVTLCGGANLFVGYMDRSIATAIFADRAVCLGGSGQASGKAIMENGGYRVSGKWRYATGAPHLTHFTANCVIEDTDLIKSFFFPKADVRIVKDWNAFGLKATASHSFEVDNLWVDEAHTFSIVPQAATWDHPIYQYPFLPFAEATLAVNTLGMARHFLECAAAIDTPQLLAQVDAAEKEIWKTRVLFYEALDASWDELTRTGTLSSERSTAVGERSRTLVDMSRKQVIATYPSVGLIAADESSTINRVWRDLFTASQHRLLRW